MENINDIVKIFLTAMTPIGELRASIPLGLSYLHQPWFLVFVVSVMFITQISFAGEFSQDAESSWSVNRWGGLFVSPNMKENAVDENWDTFAHCKCRAYFYENFIIPIDVNNLKNVELKGKFDPNGN